MFIERLWNQLQMYKFDKRVWNLRIRRTVIVSLVVPLLAVMPQAPVAVAAPACVEGTHYSMVSAAGAATAIYKFTNTSSECTFTLPTGLTTASLLAVGAGGGGGPDGGGGGGGGELRYNAAQSLSGISSIDILVGTGGTGAVWGGSSTSGTATTVKWNGSTQYQANGGSRADGWSSSGPPGGAGGSGGLGGNANSNGQAGGYGPYSVCVLGSAPSGTTPSNSITGSSVNYGGGGGGGMGNNNQNAGTAYLGAAGGGTSGGRGANFKLAIDGVTAINGASNGSPGTANTGGGGGGGSACDARGPWGTGLDGVSQRTAGGRGADGVVILSFSRIAQTITFGSIANRRITAGTLTVAPTSSSGLTVALTSATTSVCTVSGFVITPVTAGTCTINANQAGNNNFSPATQVQQSFTISPNYISYNSNNATTTRAIESTTANTLTGTTLSKGRLVQGAPISNGLVLHLDGSDASTVSGSTWTNKVAGVSGAEASATLVGSPTYDAAEGAFTLNGTSQYFTLGTTNYLYNGALPFTVNLSFKASDVFRDNCLIGNFNGGVGATYMYRVYNGVLYGNRNVTPWETNGTTRVPAGEIQYASMSFDGSYLRLYLNGVLHATSALISASVSYSGGTRIGGCQDSSSPSRLFKGQIYNAQIYNRALSGTEIATNYQNLIPAQLAAKTNYSLGPWTTGVDTGTAFGTTSYDLSALPTPYFRVSAENYSGGTLSASVGGSRLSITKNGSPVLNSNSGGGYGANARFATISGGTGDGFRLGNAEMPNYTFCGMARYKDLDTGVKGTQGRIFSYGSGTNWLSGWYAGGVKNFFHNEWLLGHFTTPDQQWHVVCDAGNEIYWDGVKQTVTTRAYTSLPPLAINWTVSGDNSNYEFTEAIVYDQVLSASQIGNIYRYFENKFGLTGITTSALSASVLTPPTNYTNSGDATLNASWFSLITYDGNKQTSGTPPASHAITNLGGTAAAVGSLVKTGYRFTGWNTAANGSGTRYAAGAPLANTGNLLLYAQWALPVALPVAANNPSALSPYMRLVASDYDAANKIWRDSSGNSRNVTRIIGTPSLTTSSGNGSSKTISVIAGGVNDKIYFDNAPISTNWTVFALSRYSGASNRNRIISGNYSASAYQDSSGNWLMGQWNGQAAVGHFNGWVANSSATPAGLTVTDWVMSTGFPYNYRYNGISRGTSGGTAELPPIGINTISTEVSDYQVAEVIIYDRTLTSSEITQVEDYFDETYGLSYAKVGTYQTASTLIIGAGVGGRSDTFTAADGLGTKTFTLSPVVSGISIDTSTANGVALVISSLVPSGTYVETITATDQAGLTAQHVVTVTVSPAVKFDTSTATTVITTSGRAAQLRLNTVNGVGSKIFTISQTSATTSPRITLDTSTAASGYATLKVDTYTAPGTYTASIVVTDSTRLRSTYIVTITVNAPPTLVSTSPLTTAPILSDLRVNLDAGNINSYSGSGSTWTDLSGNGRNGTLQSSPTFSKNNGGILSFNGSNQYVTVPSVRSEVFTVETWVKFEALNNNYACVISNQYSTDKINYAICFWGNSTIRAGYHQSGTGWAYTGAFTPVVGTWYQLVYKVEKIGSNYIGSLYQNGNLVATQSTSTVAPNNDQLVDRIGRRWDNGEYINGSIPIVRIYSRALSDSEIIQNYNATSPRFLNSPTNSVTLATTQGVATSTSLYYAGLGTGTKTFSISPSVAGVTLDTSTVNTVKINFDNTLQATDSATARVITQTVTAYDSMGQAVTTPVYISTTINPPIVITPSIPTTLTTTFGVTAYDTFTATRGMGGPYTFSVQSSAYQSAFTMTKPSANVGLLTVANNLPAGTYYETITATDSATASTTYLLTVIVNPGMTLTPVGSSTLTTTITKSASLRINIANGTGAKTLTISSPAAGITLDSSTVGSGYVTINVGTNVPANTYSVGLTVRDTTGSTTSGTFSVVVNKWPVIGTPTIPTSALRIHLDAANGSSYSGSGTTWTDLSGSGKNGTWQNSPVFSSDSGGTLKIGNATTQFMQSAGLGSMDTLTAEVWVKFSSIPTGDACILSDKYNATYINFSICFNNASQIVGGYWNSTDGWRRTAATSGITTNTWYHLVYTVSRSGTTYSPVLYLNGNQVGAITTNTIAPRSGSTGFLVGTNWRADSTVVPGEVALVRVYNRSFTAAEVNQNFNAQGNRFLATNSGTSSLTTTQGLTTSISNVIASEGSGTKTFVISPVQTGITLDTSVANRYSLNIASTLEATDSSTAKTFYETVTATDSTTASTTLAYTIVVNPPVRLTVTTDTVTTTSGIAAFDTFTATLGTGNKTFTLTGSPTTSGFTLTQANNVAVLKVEPTANPGTYFETVTATDSLGATTSKMIRVVVAPGPTLTGSNNLVSARGIAFVSPVYAVANGIAPYTYSLTSRAVSPDTNTVAGITFDTATMTLRVSAAVGAGTYLETITVRDVNGATSNYLINLEVKPPVVLSGSMSITKTYGDLTVSNYTTSAGIPPFTFTTSTPSVTNVCVPMKGTFIGDGTNGTLGVSYTYEKIVGTERCNWIAPNGVTSVDYAVVGGGGGGGNGRGGGGGGGGVATGTGLSITSGSFYDIAVAGGGSATNDGNDSWIRSGDLSTMYVYASGGGAGGSMSADLGTITGNNGRSAASATASSAGGSGGGGGNNYHNFTAPGTSWSGDPGSGGTGTASGFAGGGSYRCSTSANSQDGNSSAGGNGGRTTGGGGGAGGAGIGYSGSCPTYSASQAPNGGAGVVSLLTGSAETYGGGGGGADGRTEATSESIYKSSGRGLGNGGGGNGQTYRQPDGTILASALVATSGDYNTGGGGGGGISSAGNGGSGVVVLRYVTPVADSQTVTMNTVSNGVASAGSVTLTIPENTPVGSITSKTIRVVQTGGATTDYTINVTINKATPTVALSLPGSVATAQYGTPVTISAAASTAGNVLFKYGNTNITACSAVATSAGVASCSWTPNALGVTTLKATLTPTDTTNYNNSNEATFAVTVGKADTLTVTASNESLTYTGSTSLVTKPFTQSGLVTIDSLTAVSMVYSGTANDGSSYSSSTAPTKAGTYVITPDTSTAGISTISGNYLGVNVTSGMLTINRAPNTSSLVYPTVNTNSAVTSPPATNYITFRPGLTDTPTTSSRLGNGVITYATSTPSNCSVDSSTAVMSLIEAGSCVVEMTVAEGDNYLADSATATITIAKGDRTISLSSTTSTLKYTDTATVVTAISYGALDGTITYSLNSSPGCSFDALGGILTATSGTLACTLNATIAEGTNFLTATTASALSMTIAKADAPIIVMDTVTAVDYSPGNRAAISPTYTISGFKGTDAASSLTLTYSFVSNPFETFSYSDTRTPIDAGTYRITPSAIVMSSGLATNYETPNYAGAAINFTVNRIAQDPVTIDGVNGEVSVPFTLVYRGGNNPTATATFTKVSGASCTVTGNGLNATEAGLCVVTVTVPGNRNYLAITSDSITVRVRNFTLVPVFVFGNGTTGITIAPNTTLTVGETACTSGCVPTLTGISPYAGAEGDVITLTGTNFTGALRVIFNVFTNATTFNVDSDTQITVQVPAGLTAGEGTLEVVTPGGITARWFDFEVLP